MATYGVEAPRTWRWKPLTLARLLERTDEGPDGCRLWNGTLDSSGYGKIQCERVSWGIHRLAWVLANGPIATGLEVDHLCFNRPCINLEHLQLLPALENRARSRAALSETCARGHRYDDGNLRIEIKSSNGKPVRRCQECKYPNRYRGPKPRSTCKRGHELTPENTYRPPGEPTRRVCVTCKRLRAAS